MRGRDGSTLFELLTVLAVAGVLAGVAVPGAARVRSTFAGAEGARRLALVLRAAQAEAQSRSGPVRVEVGAGGDYTVTGASGDLVASGRLGARVTSTYPGGVLEFTQRGWARIPGSSSPRAGHFGIAGAVSSATVVVQLSGCVRCT
jgi:Tfp pilus assembly protein FimT